MPNWSPYLVAILSNWSPYVVAIGCCDSRNYNISVLTFAFRVIWDLYIFS